jgi:rhamnogalacturonyl hydrolase YesR
LTEPTAGKATLGGQIGEAIDRLDAYVRRSHLKGYDPYDTLNSWIPFSRFGKWGAPIATQVQKRNPVNLRPFLGIGKGHNPKGMGLFLRAYTTLYGMTKDELYENVASEIFDWLIQNTSRGFSGHCWGYNFPWASPGSYLEAFTPSVVVTAFVVDALYEYYRATQNEEAEHVIMSAARFIENDIPVSEFAEGISFAYTHLSKGACYNASLLAAEVLAKAQAIEGASRYNELIQKAVRFVLSKQNPDGSWFYSFDPETGRERKQIDFHQGFVLVSLHNLLKLTGILREQIEGALRKGLWFYRERQFLPSGRSMGRLPKKWPVDIHNQSQGIITFARLAEFDPEYISFAGRIASWTIENMQDREGFFYYQKTRFFTNRIPYMRWAQAWMVLALCELAKGRGRRA